MFSSSNGSRKAKPKYLVYLPQRGPNARYNTGTYHDIIVARQRERVEAISEAIALAREHVHDAELEGDDSLVARAKAKVAARERRRAREVAYLEDLLDEALRIQESTQEQGEPSTQR